MKSTNSLQWPHPSSDAMWFAFIAVVVVAMVQTLILSKRSRKKLPPGPWAWPIIGNLPSLGPLPHQSLRKLALKHGDLMYLRLGCVPCIVISSAAAAKDFIANHDLQFAYRPLKLFNSILFKDRDIITSSYGPVWRHLRSICTMQLLTKKRIASFHAGRREEIHSLMKLILRKSVETTADTDGVPVDLRFQLLNTSTNIMTRMVLNKRFFEEDEGESSEQAQRRYQNMVSAHFASHGIFVISDYIPYLSFITKLQGIEKKLTETAKTITEILDEMIDLDARETSRRVGDEQDANHVKDFVDLLMSTASPDGTGRLDDATIRLVVLDMLFAGAETQSTTIEWAMAHLLRAPDVMRRLQAELDDVIGTHRVVEESDLEHLPYLDAVVKEIHRLQPGAPLGLNHQSRAPRCVAGFDLPANTRMYFNLHAIHRDPSIYDRADEFDPARFLPRRGDKSDPARSLPRADGSDYVRFLPRADESDPPRLSPRRADDESFPARFLPRGDNEYDPATSLSSHSNESDPETLVPRGADEFDPARSWASSDKFDPARPRGHDSLFLMPFGAGRRICPGLPLASLTVPTILAQLLHSFDWRLPASQDPLQLDMSEVLGITARRKQPLLVVAQPRKPAFLY